jgi:transcription elongation factor GreA
MREDGYETIMVNCNPETVSTDYDTSDRLYFEPVTLEDVLEIVAKEKPVGVIVQYGGQTPLKLALDLERAGVPIVGTSPDSIDVAEDRERFQKLLTELGLRQPPNRTARTEEQALVLAQEIGYPLVVRPSYVLGGRAMEIVHGDKDLERYMREAVKVSEKSPVLLDRFLDDAIEVDVDCISDGAEVMIGGIMEHVEQAGIHSGDSACSLPPYSLPKKLQDELRRQTALMAKALKVVGLMNVQFAIQGDVAATATRRRSTSSRSTRARRAPCRSSPRRPASRSPRSRPAAWSASRSRARRTFAARSFRRTSRSRKRSSRSTSSPASIRSSAGDALDRRGHGGGRTFGEAMLKSQLGAGSRLPTRGTVCITVRNGDKPRAVAVAARAARARLPARRDARHGGGDQRGGHAGRAGQQGQGRPAAHRRHAEERRDPARLHDRRRDAHGDCRLASHPPGGARPPGDVLHQHGGLRGGGRRHEASRRPGGHFAPGTAFRTALNWPLPPPPESADGGFSFFEVLVMATIPLTRRGAEKLREELSRLKNVERHAVIQAISEARAQGDLSENAEYEAAKDKQGFIEGRILEVESKLAAAQIIDPKNVDADGRVVFGSTVDLEEEDSGAKVTYQIVGDDEADLKQGWSRSARRSRAR